MTKQTEAMNAALTALKSIDEAMPFPVAKYAIRQLEEALAEQRSGIKQVIELYDSPEQPAQQRLELIGHADLTIMNIHVFSKYGDTEIPEGRIPLYAGYKK